MPKNFRNENKEKQNPFSVKLKNKQLETNMFYNISANHPPIYLF